MELRKNEHFLMSRRYLVGLPLGGLFVVSRLTSLDSRDKLLISLFFSSALKRDCPRTPFFVIPAQAGI